MRSSAFTGVLLLSLLAPACKLGKENVIFTTSTSIGIDLDSAPTKVTVGYDRFEGSIGPTTEKGQVLPLLSGIAMSTNPILAAFGFGIATTFAAGPAAVIGSKYLALEESYKPSLDELKSDLGALATIGPAEREAVARSMAAPREQPGGGEGSRELEKKETERTPMQQDKELLGVVWVEPSKDVDRYFFATDTSLGFNVAFAAGAPAAPEAISLGYKRKELAILPVSAEALDGGTALFLPSIVATSSGEAKAGADEASLGVSQFYATGMAANYLMAHKDIRRNIIERTGADALAEKKAELKANEDDGEALEVERDGLLARLSGAALDEAWGHAKTLDFKEKTNQPFPANGNDDAKRTYIKGRTNVGNDPDEVRQLRRFVDHLKTKVR